MVCQMCSWLLTDCTHWEWDNRYPTSGCSENKGHLWHQYLHTCTTIMSWMFFVLQSWDRLCGLSLFHLMSVSLWPVFISSHVWFEGFLLCSHGTGSVACLLFPLMSELSVFLGGFFISSHIWIKCFAFGTGCVACLYLFPLMSELKFIHFVFCSRGILTNHCLLPQCPNSDLAPRPRRVCPQTLSRAPPPMSPPRLPPLPPPPVLLQLLHCILRSTPTTVFPVMQKLSSITWPPWAFQGHGLPALLRSLVLMRERYDLFIIIHTVHFALLNIVSLLECHILIRRRKNVSKETHTHTRRKCTCLKNVQFISIISHWHFYDQHQNWMLDPLLLC